MKEERTDAITTQDLKDKLNEANHLLICLRDNLLKCRGITDILKTEMNSLDKEVREYNMIDLFGTVSDSIRMIDDNIELIDTVY